MALLQELADGLVETRCARAEAGVPVNMQDVGHGKSLGGLEPQR